MNDIGLFVLTLLTSLLGAHATYWLTHKQKMNSVRAASLSSVIFSVIALATQIPLLLSLQAAFFGSTYVAMSEPARLSERKVLLAGAAFAVILFTLQKIDFFHFHGGIGGTLGGSAFLACLLIYVIERTLFSRSRPSASE